MCEDQLLSSVRTPHEQLVIEVAFARGPVITLDDLEVSWDGVWTLLLGSHNIMNTALGSCVKWP